MNSDPQDELLRRLGDRVRQDEQAEAGDLDERWARLCDDTASEDERQALRDLAASDPEAARFEEAFRPLDDDFRARLATGALERLSAEPSSAEASKAGSSSAEPSSAEPSKAGPSRAEPSKAGPSSLRAFPVPDHTIGLPNRRSSWRVLALAAGLVAAVGLAPLLDLRAPIAEGDFAGLQAATSRQRSVDSMPRTGLDGEASGRQPPVDGTSDSGGPLENTGPLPVRAGEPLFLTLDTTTQAAQVPSQRLSLFIRAADGEIYPLSVDHDGRAVGKVDLRARPPMDLPAGRATLIVAVHAQRDVDIDQVLGNYPGRWKQLLYGSWQRLELELEVEALDPDLSVEFFGCDEVRGPPEHPTCRLSEHESLGLWVSTEVPQRLVVELGAQRWTADDAEPRHGGLVFQLDPLAKPDPPEPMQLAVRLDGGSSSPEIEPPSWTLRLAPPADSAQSDPQYPQYPQYQQAEALSRIPLYRDSHDNVVGYVLQREILKRVADGCNQDISLESLMRPVPFIPEVATVAAAMRQILERREPIAMAIDEHGGISGLVTLEDLTETVLGVEIVDESDRIVDQRLAAAALRDQRLERLRQRRKTRT